MSHFNGGTANQYHFIFDFDGVLGDTEYDVSCITQELAAARGFSVPVEEIHRRFSGCGTAVKFSGIADLCKGSFNQASLTELRSAHEERKKALYVRPHFPLVDGVLPVLETLHNAGHRLSVATSNSDEVAILAIEKAGLSPYFNDRVFGCNAPEEKKPAPHCYQRAIALAEQQAPGLVSIGIEDSISGIKAAVQACDFSIGLLDPRFGTGEVVTQKIEEFRGLGAFAVIRHYREFQQTLTPLLSPIR